MADKKISALTAASTPLAGTEVLPIVQGGSTVKVPVENVITSAQPSATANTVAYLNGSKQLSYSSNLAFDGSSFTFGVGGGAKLIAFNSQTIASINTGGSAYTDMLFDANDLIVRTGVGGATESLRVSDAGDVTAARGNLVIGTAGKGIDFSANPAAPGMTSELLNDYEEGTFTPSFTSTGLSVVYGQQTGMYTKVGRMVTASVYILVNSTSGTLTNALSIAGLPFSTPGGVEYGFSVVFGVYQFTGVTPTGFMGALATNIQLYQAGTVTPLTGAALAPGYYLATITYSASS